MPRNSARNDQVEGRDSQSRPGALIEEAARLTTRLAAVEQYLANVSWKAETSVAGEDLILAFERSKGTWCLKCTLTPSMEPQYWSEILLKDASITVKSKVAKLLPLLIESMRSEFEERLRELSEANAALDEVNQALSKAGA